MGVGCLVWPVPAVSWWRDMPFRSSMLTEACLLVRLGSGDDIEAWLEFFRRYGGLLRRFALGSGLDAQEAEEVVQDTAIGVARGLRGFAMIRGCAPSGHGCCAWPIGGFWMPFGAGVRRVACVGPPR